jgi:hypothetical protein
MFVTGEIPNEHMRIDDVEVYHLQVLQIPEQALFCLLDYLLRHIFAPYRTKK